MIAHWRAVRLGITRCLGDYLRRSQFAQQRDTLRHAFRPIDLEQDAAQVLIDRDRCVAGGIDPAGDAILDLAKGDLVGDMNSRLQPGAASLLHVIGGSRWRQAGAKHDLPGQVEVATVLEDGAGGDLTEPGALQAEAGDEPVQCRGEHVLVGGAGVGAVGAGERDPVAAQNGGAAEVSHLLVVHYVDAMV